MALSKTVTYDMISILANGVVQIRKKTAVDEDGAPLGEKYHRYVYEPGADISSEPARVKAIINAVWTPAVIAAWQAEKAARDALMPK
jgi:hypothetical protein